MTKQKEIPSRIWIDSAGRIYPINPDNADFDSAPVAYIREDTRAGSTDDETAERVFADWQARLWKALGKTPGPNIGMESAIQFVEAALATRERPSTDDEKVARDAAEGLTAQLFEVEGFGDYTNTQQREGVFDLAKQAFVLALTATRVPAAGEVEAALAELREMFPEDDVAIKVSDCEKRAHYWIQLNDADFTNADTLPEAMAKVREFKAGEPKPDQS